MWSCETDRQRETRGPKSRRRLDGVEKEENRKKKKKTRANFFFFFFAHVVLVLGSRAKMSRVCWLFVGVRTEFGTGKLCPARFVFLLQQQHLLMPGQLLHWRLAGGGVVVAGARDLQERDRSTLEAWAAADRGDKWTDGSR